MPACPLADLAGQIETEARASGVAIAIEHGTADGFGMTDAAILDVSIAHGGPVRVWDEGDGDVWLELPGEEIASAWWRQGRKEATLAEVVIALAQGRYAIASGVVSVTPPGRKALTLKDVM